MKSSSLILSILLSTAPSLQTSAKSAQHPQHDSSIQPGDIIINEILSNPKIGGVDFVELYNLSDKIIDLQQLTIASVNSKGVTGNPRKIATHPVLIFPHEYKVLSPNPAIIQQHYPNSNPRAFVEMTTLPNFNNESGGVVLSNGLITIDSAFYDPGMRSPLVANPKGISLERQHFSMPANAIPSFHSAATVVGGATPGYPNSQSPDGTDPYEFSLQSRTFSPDNDGYEDALKINYNLPQSGWMATIDIYNTSGYRVKKLYHNQSLATQGEIHWDGLSDSGQPLPVGIYVAIIESYHPAGKTKKYRLSFVLATRL